MARHLIHIGYPKTGSTFLQVWFGRHPELRYRPGGLGGFYSVYELAWPSSCGTFKYYVTSCEDLSMPNECTGGEHWDWGYAEPEPENHMKEKQAAICSALRSLFPGSVVLVVTRGFREIITSGYSQCVKSGGRLHFGGMCRQLVECLRNERDHYLDFDYSLRLYGEAFGEENLIVMPYELLRDDQDRFLTTLEDRLGIGHACIELGRVNPSLTPEELYWYPFLSRAVAAAAARLGDARFQKVYRWYIGQLRAGRLRPLAAALRRLWPNGRITDADFDEEVLAFCRGNATLLQKFPLYAPYAAEYLWEES